MFSRSLIRILLIVALLPLSKPASAQSGNGGSPLLYDVGSPSMTKTIEPEEKPVSSEVASLLRDLESPDIKTRIRAAKIATRNPFSENILYRKIEEKLRSGFKIKPDDRHHVDEMSWYCKALAESGNQKYSAILKEASTDSPSTKIQRYAQKCLLLLNTPPTESSRTEPKTTPGDAPTARNLNAQENQLLSMLSSTDLGTVRDAGKLIYRSHKLDSMVYDAAEKKILQLLPRAGEGRLQSDTIAWLCKALIISEDKKYIRTLDKVEKSDGSASLRSHAQRAHERLDPPEDDGSFDSI